MIKKKSCHLPQLLILFVTYEIKYIWKDGNIPDPSVSIYFYLLMRREAADSYLSITSIFIRFYETSGLKCVVRILLHDVLV